MKTITTNVKDIKAGDIVLIKHAESFREQGVMVETLVEGVREFKGKNQILLAGDSKWLTTYHHDYFELVK